MSELTIRSVEQREGRAAVFAAGGGALVSLLAFVVLRRRVSDVRRAWLTLPPLSLSALAAWKACKPRCVSVDLPGSRSCSGSASNYLLSSKNLTQLDKECANLPCLLTLSSVMDHFALHERLNGFIDQLTNPEDHARFERALEELETRLLVYPNGYQTRLDFSVLRDRAQGIEPQVTYERVERVGHCLLEDLEKLECEGFLVPKTVLDMKKNLERSDCHAFVAVDECGDIAGYIQYRVKGKKACIESICRRPSWTRVGCGRNLMRRALADAKRKGAVSCSLQVRELSVAATCLCKAFGFRSIGREGDDDHSLTESSILMRADVSAALLLGELDAVAWALEHGENVSSRLLNKERKAALMLDSSQASSICKKIGHIEKGIRGNERAMREWSPCKESLERIRIQYPDGHKGRLLAA